MKYAILVCDGAADWPIPELGHKTIFEAANIPNMNFLAQHGKMGLLKTVPDSMDAGSECANMTILGYNPEKELTGRGPLEALSAGISLNEKDLAFRCNLVTIKDGLIDDYSAGHISSEEGKNLIGEIRLRFNTNGIEFFPGIQYRHILKLDGNTYSDELILTPPHDILNKPYKNYLPKPKNENNNSAKNTAKLLSTLIEQSNSILIDHPININRIQKGKKPATHIWFWSGGHKPFIKPFKEKYGLAGGVISAVDLIFGLGIAANLKPIHVEGATGLPDTNYFGKAKAGLDFLKDNDFILIHVEATDEMGHSGDYEMKKKALEDFDKYIVGEFLKSEPSFNNELVICVLPDHPTPCALRTHIRDPVPFVIYNPKSKIQNKNRIFSEKFGSIGEFGLIKDGETFIKILLGLKN